MHLYQFISIEQIQYNPHMHLFKSNKHIQGEQKLYKNKKYLWIKICFKLCKN